MDRSSIVIAALAALVWLTPAVAGTEKFTATPGQVDQACIATDGQPTMTQTGGYGCRTGKGKVECTADGNCTGTCAKCGTAQRDKTKRGKLNLDQVLRNGAKTPPRKYR